MDAQSLEAYLKRVLILSDKKAGHLNQSVAFAKIKGYEYNIVEVNVGKYKKALSYLLDFFHIYLDIFGIRLSKTGYDAIISTGSSTYYINKLLSKKLSCKSIAIMLPKGFRYSDFDYIIANLHDNPPKRENIVQIPLNLCINKPKGYIKKTTDKKALGVIIGGDNQIFKMNKDTIKNELDKIYDRYKEYEKYVTTSRRTTKEIEELIESYKWDYKLIYSQNKEINPIPDFIDICDELFITMDSTSMLSEAKANSKANIHIIKLSSKKTGTKYHKIADIVKNLDKKIDFKKLLERIEI